MLQDLSFHSAFICPSSAAYVIISHKQWDVTTDIVTVLTAAAV